jgi:hypothetical protein
MKYHHQLKLPLDFPIEDAVCLQLVVAIDSYVHPTRRPCDLNDFKSDTRGYNGIYLTSVNLLDSPTLSLEIWCYQFSSSDITMTTTLTQTSSSLDENFAMSDKIFKGQQQIPHISKFVGNPSRCKRLALTTEVWLDCPCEGPHTDFDSNQS